MKIITELNELRKEVADFRRDGLSIGFVPTMGNLHEGHLSLVDAASNQCDVVIVSIFVNPLQFGPNEDFDTYPVTPEEDESLLRQHKTTLLYRPQVESIYPNAQSDKDNDKQSRVTVPIVSEPLCGLSRPHFFSGVATVVNTLFNQVQPDIAYFGKKDYQQLLVIKKMVADFSMNLAVTGVDTVREDSGLAMSSRNSYLTEEELQQAAVLQQVLQQVAKEYQFQDDNSNLLEQAWHQLKQADFRPDYLSVRRQEDLQPPSDDDKHLIVLAAAWMAGTRLIDNLEFER